jgi:hypothetical protein
VLRSRLRDAGLLQVPSVLAARAPAAPVLPRSSAPPLLPTPSGGDGRPHIRTHCDYCGKDGHRESDCFKKNRHNKERTSSGTRASPSTSSTVSFT